MPQKKHTEIAKLANEYGIVLLYHSISPDSRKQLPGTHTIHPKVLERHVADLSEFFRFVSLEEFVHQRTPAGLAALTFDDGYRDVLRYAGPVLSRLNLEACMYLNTATLMGGINWRDKVRYIIQCKREQEFLKYYPINHDSGRFYRSTKHPANNSAELDHALDRFLGRSGESLDTGYPYLTRDDIVESAENYPNFRFGNHSANHYVLSSLADDQQAREIEDPVELVSSLPCRTETASFSIPFGEDRDINARTAQLVRQSGYANMLMSRQRLQARFPLQAGVRLIDRFLPRTQDILSEILAAHSDTCRNPMPAESGTETL